jgi:hypothetical protein
MPRGFCTKRCSTDIGGAGRRYAPDCPLASSVGTPDHLPMSRAVPVGADKAMACVQQRRPGVRVQDAQPYPGRARSASGALQPRDEQGADPAATRRCGQCDLHKAPAWRGAIRIESSGSVPFYLDDPEVGGDARGGHMTVLERELTRGERCPDIVGPGRKREFRRTEFGVELLHERDIGVDRRAKPDALSPEDGIGRGRRSGGEVQQGQPNEGKLPTSATA